MASINRAILTGRITKDPELKKTSSGLSVTRFTVAVQRRKSSNQQEDPGADFVPCIAWRGTADYIAQYCKKGTMMAVEGRIQTGSYEDRDGKKVYTTDIVCDNVQRLSYDNSGANGISYGGTRDGANNTYNGDRGAYETNTRSTSTTSNNEFDYGDTLVISSDDLPF